MPDENKYIRLPIKNRRGQILGYLCLNPNDKRFIGKNITVRVHLLIDKPYRKTLSVGNRFDFGNDGTVLETKSEKSLMLPIIAKK